MSSRRVERIRINGKENANPLTRHAAMVYNSAKDAHDVAKRLSEKWGTEIKAYQANVGESDKIRAVFTQVEKEMGPIHGVVANSGISVVKPALELNADDFKKVFDVNVLGVFNTAQAAAE